MPSVSRGHYIRSIASRFAAAQEGNIAVTFAFAIIPVLAAVRQRQGERRDDGVFADWHADREAACRKVSSVGGRDVEITKKPGHIAGLFEQETSNSHTRQSAWGCECKGRCA